MTGLIRADRVSVITQLPIKVDTTIANGQALSAPVALNGGLLGSVRLPNSAGWTDASLTFMVSLDGGSTYGELYVDGTAYTVTVPTGRNNPSVFLVEPRYFVSITHVIVRSGTVGTPVNQGGTRALQLGVMA